MLKKILIISTSGYLEKAKKYADYLSPIEKFEVLNLDCPLFNDEPILAPKAIEHYFNDISGFLEKYSMSQLRDLLVIFGIQVSLPHPDSKKFLNDIWNPLLIFSEERKRAHSRAILLSMLFLTFPEVQWYFLCENSKCKSSTPCFLCQNWQCKSEDSCVHLLPPFFNFRDYFVQGLEKKDEPSKTCVTPSRFFNTTPLFDFPGLRNKIRQCIKPSTDADIPAFPLRHSFAASIDEEEPYAFLHGYLAYKIGYKCLVVTDQESMELLSKEEKKEKIECNTPVIELAFEDLFLNFPDRSHDDIHLSDLSKRDNQYGRLKEVSKRILVTVGHKNIDWYQKNHEYIRELKAMGKMVNVVHKPSSGMYNILERSALLKEYWQRRQQGWKLAKPQYEGGAETGGHSAPGRMLLIAEKLIDRARKIFKDAETVQDCIHGATLALEACELLCSRTPTTTLEAVALKHKLEVKAECMFYGVEYIIDVKNRILELQNEVKTVSLWFHPGIRKRSILDAQMRIITDITRIFRESGHFDEELTCLNYLRKLNRHWALKQRGLKRVLNFLIYPVRSYIETLVGSLTRFCLALIGWPTLLGLFSKLSNAQYGDKIQSLHDHLAHAYFTFFGLQPNEFPMDSHAYIITMLLVFGGFMHLGIFISHLYTLITRR